MAAKIDISVGVLDNTAAGLASIAANAAKAQQQAGGGDTFALGQPTTGTYDLAPDPAALAATEKLNREVEALAKNLQRAAEMSEGLAREMQDVDFPIEEIETVRRLAQEVDNARQAASIAADAFEALGQTDAAGQLRMGLADTAGSARQLKAALDQLEIRKLAQEMNAAGTAAKSTAVDLGKAGREAIWASSGFQKLQQAATGAAGKRSGSGQGIMQLAYAADDLQYGMRGIVNNIPGLVMGLGAGAGLAGVISIAAVAINVLLPHIEKLSEKLSKDGFAKTATAGIAALTNQYSKLELVLEELVQPIQATNDAAANNQHSIDALKKEIAEYERLAQAKANQKTIGDALNENREKAGNRATEQAREELDTVAKVEARMKGLQAYIDVQSGIEVVNPDSAEQLKKTFAELDKLAAQKDRIAKSDEKKAKEVVTSDADAAYKRELDFHASQIKTLDQVRARLEEIATLKKGKSTGVAGAFDLDEQSAKRLHSEEQNLLNLEVTLAKAMRDRLQDNARLATESIDKSREQAAELAKQAELTEKLHGIEKRRAAVASGADDPRAEAARAQSESRRDAFLDRVKAKTQEAQQASQKADADEGLSDDAKLAKRDAYAAAVQDQITAEADAKRQTAEEHAAREQSQAVKSAALDQEAVAVRQAEVAASVEALADARANDAAADRDNAAGADGRRAKATAELTKAEAEKLKAEAELTRQIESNETRRKDTAETNQNARTRQRIADEIAVGRAREGAMIAADAQERAIEDAKNARRQGALEQDPRIQEAARQIGQRIKPKDVRAVAMKRRQDAAAKKFIAERKRAGKKVKAGDVKQVREAAGIQFIADVKGGRANAEIAQVGNEMFDRMVAQARGLADPVANALRAIAAKAARDIIDAAEKEGGVAQAEKARPGDPAAARRNLTPEELKAQEDAARAERVGKNKAADAARRQAAQDRKDKARDAEFEQQKVDENVRDVDEKKNPEQKAEREAKEDAEFRAQREKERDEKAQAEFERNQTSQPVANAARDLVSQTERANAAKAKTDGEILAALQELTRLQTDLANQQAATRDVVQQVTDHVNGLQAQIVAQGGSTTRRSQQAGAV